MKKMPDRLKLDGRKRLVNNLIDNGFKETMKENRTENGAYAKIKQRKIKMLERKIAESTDQAEIEKMKSEIEKKEQQIENHLNK